MTRNRAFMLFGLGKGEYSWKGVCHLLALFFGTLFVAALLSGPIYLFLNGMDNSLARYLARRGICKIYSRTMLVTAILSLPLFLRGCGLKISQLGCDLKNVKSMLKWFTIGLVFAVAVVGIEILATGAAMECNLETLLLLARKLPKFILSAAVVGILEEVLFRGVILRAFYTACNLPWAIILPSLFFAYAHIKVPAAANVNGGDIGPLSGFKCLIPTLFGFLYEFKVWQFTKLTLFGIILSLLTLRNRSLNQAIGFHAGTVFMLFSANVFIN